MSDEVYLNGELVPRAEARISPFDRGFLYGDGLFETVRVVNGIPFRLGRHLERMNRSCAALGWGRQLDSERLRAATEELIERNAVAVGYLRITASRGPLAGKLTDLEAASPTVLIDAHAMDLPPLDSPPDYVLAGSPHRAEPASLLVRHKTLSYQAYLLALAEGRAKGADEVYFLNSCGHLTEGATVNLFFVRSGTVCTPDEGCGLLPGVTREAVMELCEAQGIPLSTGEFTPEELMQAEEAFCTNSLRGVVRVSRLLGPPDTEFGRGPVTVALQSAYAALVDAECQRE
jgi:branched-chain amino acid aminotransferase